MTFLELCVSLRSLAGMQGTGPTTVVSQIGEYYRVVEWIKNSWIKIQNQRKGKWKFLQSDFSKNTIADTTEYEFYTADGVKSFDRDSFQIYLNADGANTKENLAYVPYKTFRSRYLDFSDSDKPVAITVTPTNKLKVYPAPDAVYTILADAYDKPVVLAADGDTPAVTEDYHMMIVYRALLDYAGYEEAGNIFEYATTEYARLYEELLWTEEDSTEEFMTVRSQ